MLNIAKLVPVADRVYHIVGRIFHNLTRERCDASWIPCEKTVREALSRGVSVGDYVEELWDQKGSTQRVIKFFGEHIDLHNCANLCEIGPGTGRYLHLLLPQVRPNVRYVIYEVASDWAHWLEREYRVTRRDADGISLKYESDDSFDFVHANGVFTTLKPLHALKYIAEMRRVAREGACIAFDFFPQESFNGTKLHRWLETIHTYPSIIPTSLVRSYCGSLGMTFVAKIPNKYGASFSEYHLYRVEKCT
jgi:phospholipid N-methyltransferase